MQSNTCTALYAYRYDKLKRINRKSHTSSREVCFVANLNKQNLLLVHNRLIYYTHNNLFHHFHHGNLEFCRSACVVCSNTSCSIGIPCRRIPQCCRLEVLKKEIEIMHKNKLLKVLALCSKRYATERNHFHLL